MKEKLQTSDFRLVYAPMLVYEHGYDSFGEKGVRELGYVTNLAYLVSEEKIYLPNGKYDLLFKVVFLKDENNIDEAFDFVNEPIYYFGGYSNALVVDNVYIFDISGENENKFLMDGYCAKLNEKMRFNYMMQGSTNKIKESENRFDEIINGFSDKINGWLEKEKVKVKN